MPTKLTVDTNIIFSAIIKPGKIRDLILQHQELELYAPEELAMELEELKPKIPKYTRLTREEANLITNTILNKILKIIPRQAYLQEASQALKLLEKTDPKDTPFVALAMHLKTPLWTGDKGILELAAKTEYKYFVAIDTQGVELLLLEGTPLEKVKERMKQKYVTRYKH